MIWRKPDFLLRRTTRDRQHLIANIPRGSPAQLQSRKENKGRRIKPD
jgi:hypothetical protein